MVQTTVIKLRLLLQISGVKRKDVLSEDAPRLGHVLDFHETQLTGAIKVTGLVMWYMALQAPKMGGKKTVRRG